jgi:hypothetical protein
MRHRCGNHAGLLVSKTRDVFDCIGGGFTREQGHTVIGFLTKPLRLIACCQQLGMREFVVGHFGFLQHQGIDRIGR